MDLASDLADIVGERLSCSSAELYCYSCDASQVRGRPEYVVRPKDRDEVSMIMALAFEKRVPVTPRGAGTGLAGGAVPLKGGIVLDLSSMDRILEIDCSCRQVLVEPGVVRDRLNLALLPSGLFFPPDPGSSAMCSIGGLLANNGSGMHCVKYGTTRDYALDLEIVLADGSVIHTGSQVLKSSAGYDLTRLFIGSEGTLGVITAARLRVVPLPKARRLVLAAFRSPEEAGLAVNRVLSAGIVPAACEILDRTTVEVLHRCDPHLALPTADLILFEADGEPTAVLDEAARIEEVCLQSAISIDTASEAAEMEEVWAARRLVGAAVSRLDPKKTRIYVGEDVGVPVGMMPVLIRRVQEISEDAGIPAMKYGHIGDGNLHVALFVDLSDEAEVERAKLAAHRIHLAALDLGGTVSAEHGVGRARSSYMRLQWGGALDVMRAIKRALDPRGILNPGKLDLGSGTDCDTADAGAGL